MCLRLRPKYCFFAAIILTVFFFYNLYVLKINITKKFNANLLDLNKQSFLNNSNFTSILNNVDLNNYRRNYIKKVCFIY